jgi:hypothetical protein
VAETFCRHCSQPIVEISHPWGATWFHQPTDELNDLSATASPEMGTWPSRGRIAVRLSRGAGPALTNP